MNLISFLNRLRPGVLSAAMCFLFGPAVVLAGSPVVIDSIVAVVNDDVITNTELTARVRSIEQRMRSQNAQLPDTVDLKRQVLERMIIERAQVQMARDAGIRIDDANLDRSMSRLAEQNKMNLQTFRDQIERDGMSFAEFREEIRNEITMMRLREREVENKIVIADSEVDNFLAAELMSSQMLQELNLVQILVRIPENASADVIASQRRKAEGVLDQVKKGDDFAKLAATFSDASDALTGGELGWRSPERLPQIFVNAAIKLADGEVAPLLKSPNGFHILKLLGRRSLPPAAGAAAPTGIVQVRARHILIKVNQVVSAADAKKKLTEVRERIVNNAAKFEDLAKSFSNDGSAGKGGDLGWLYPGDTVPEFEKAMDELKIGEVSQPVETPFGFHLIEVLERKSDDASQERRRQEARMALRNRKIEEGTDEYIRQLRGRAYVEVRLDGK
jgi:peptidyl-prolyl cis-trans isomerase SurA